MLQPVLDCRATNCPSMTVIWKGTGLHSRSLIGDASLQTVSKMLNRRIAAITRVRYTISLQYRDNCLFSHSIYSVVVLLVKTGL